MAKRLFFRPIDRKPYFEEIEIEFKYYTGFAKSQKLKSIASMHSEILKIYPESKVLEISTSSQEWIGNALSAFNLKYFNAVNGVKYNVENIFQASKVFQNGGPFKDLLLVKPWDAKKDTRIRNSGNLISFKWNDDEYTLEPKTLFYDWIYINALVQNEELVERLKSFDGFTDIEFNQNKSFNCQARSVAIFIGLYKSKKISESLTDVDHFREIYDNKNVYEQLSLFDL